MSVQRQALTSDADTSDALAVDQTMCCVGTRSGNAMQFYSWQRFRPVGPPMVEPKWIQWDPDVTVAALAYPDSLVLCRVRPNFKAIASLAIPVR